MRLTTIPKMLLAGALALTTMGAVAVPAAAAPAVVKAAEGTMTSSVQGTFTDALGGVGQVTGTFVPTEFAVQGDELVAVGTLHAVLTDSAGAPVGTADEAVTLPVQLPGSADAAALAACNILHLVLGPLDLNLLGLTVHLNTVVLDITAHSGPGNLLGNLLCAIAGLLDGGLPFPLAQLADLLNQVLAILAL
ncbi:hypothetical protein FHR83_008691 [Actinoplanes campanulatus]|uniref:Secreted protein n=1 Tax=Actinoplanes campanulatus TaxID=113559 RepID=A0A7W5AS37_9ACTN|nr:hypothetical protein [Actinoplanes campanulatus]MBB3100964.1 hypothetical protein [Actinoplanes campanulatus]GGN49017.1 hypothetical protein GCM10010109_86570 [Actinoplanes campanulatus]GID41782.1 hypothetical protein Aca09nite_82880 [Actinoplanes campanulatus]